MKVLRKTEIVVLVLFLSLTFTTGICRAQEKFIKGFSFKLSGGYGSMSVGDFNSMIQSWNNLLQDAEQTQGMTVDGAWKKIHWGLNFEGDFLLHLTENFGVGIGIGYIQVKKENEIAMTLAPYYASTRTLKPKLAALPLKLSAYYFHPMTSRMNVFFMGGIGYYFGKLAYTYTAEEKYGDTVPSTTKDFTEAKDSGFGLHGGIGFEYNLSKKFILFIEGTGTYCKLKDWKGNGTFTSSEGSTEKSSGTLWSLNEYDSSFGKNVSAILLSNEKPADPAYTNVRKMQVDLSDISFRTGFRIRF